MVPRTGRACGRSLGEVLASLKLFVSRKREPSLLTPDSPLMERSSLDLPKSKLGPQFSYPMEFREDQTGGRKTDQQDPLGGFI